MDIAELYMQACLQRKETRGDFFRLDYPEKDPPEWDKFITIRKKGQKVHVGELPFNYWLKPPSAPTYEENYNLHCGL